jgi:hypothetical protein
MRINERILGQSRHGVVETERRGQEIWFRPRGSETAVFEVFPPVLFRYVSYLVCNFICGARGERRGGRGGIE